MLSMIMAMDNDKLVGASSGRYGLPWHYPEDLAYYKNMTINKINVMGRVTYEQIGSPLANRETVVLSNNKNLVIKGATVYHHTDDILALDNNNTEIMIIGGVAIFDLFFLKISRIYLTRINDSHQGDVYYSSFNLDGFKLTSSVSGVNPVLTFETWERC